MNFEILKQKLENATKKAFIEMYEKYGTDNIYAFALYSDEDAMTICPSTNTLKYLENADPNDLYFKFAPAEWKYEMQGASSEFNEICRDLRDELDKINDDEEWFYRNQKQVFNTCIDVLEKLKNENFFRDIIGKEIFLTFTVSDYDFETKGDFKEIITKLNENEYKTEYLNWMKTWEQ